MSQNIENQRVKPSVSPREIIFRYIRYLPWIMISVAVMLVAAYIKLRYSTPIYNISSKLLVSSPTLQGGGRGDKFDDIFMTQSSGKINDEMELIKSRSMASRVIRSLGMQKEVYNIGKIRSTIVYSGDVPFNFEILEIADSSRGFGVQISFQDRSFTLNEQPQKHYYNEVIVQSGAKFRITDNNKSLKGFSNNDFIVSWIPLEKMAAGLSGGIGVNRVNDYTNMLALSYQSENTKLGVDVVNQYMEEYRQSSLEDKKEIAAKTLDFINEQLKAVFTELGGVERNLQKYRENKKVFNSEAQTQLYFEELSETKKMQAEHGISLKITDYLINYLSDNKNRNNIIPTMMNISEPALLQQITEFNRLQLERENALKNTAPNNPRILTLETSIEKLRTDMVETLRNVRQTHTLALEEIDRKDRETNQLISAIPSKEKQLLEVTRQQTILEELYQYLLQKKLETAIASASTISNIKVVESAMASGMPVSPNRKSLYILAILIGIAIPGGIIFLIEYLNDKIKSKSEIEQLTDAPILGEVGHAEGKNALVVTRNNRKFLAEQFRIIRSNLQYILPHAEKPVIMVTSSYSGEGKSFVSTNMGSVLALSGKRTVILEFDIRKPKIMQGLGMQERKGITNYIIGNVTLSEIIHQVPDVEGLYVISCGPVPPNPAEMLLNERIEQLFKELRMQFDAIIIDTAPVGLVSDALTLGRFANATVYIVRHNYTLKKQIQLIEDLYQNKKVPQLSVIINDINARGGYGGYYGYGGYGYGYGYGYSKNGGSGGYFENSNGATKEKGWQKWLPKAFKK